MNEFYNYPTDYGRRGNQTSNVQTNKLSSSKKAKALLIALVNLNLIFAVVAFKAVDIQIAGQMITAILFLAGLFLGVQGGVDLASTWRTDSSTVKNNTTNTNITKKYEYRMDYADNGK